MLIICYIEMEQYRLMAPKVLKCTIGLPASKSISNRALIIYALSGGRNLPQNLSDCDDTGVIIDAIRYMPEVIDIKAAGTAMRFMTAYLSVMRGTHTITGTERMKHRPIGILVDALRKLGADISYAGTTGFPPLRITGKSLEGGLLEIPGNVSSQYISALLMIGPMLKEGLTLQLTGEVISRPYIDLTLWTMREFGADAEWTSADTIEVKPKPYTGRDYFIENDWSGASYWYEMMALNDNPDSEIRLTGLMDGSKQGDSVYDFINSPDLAQTFVVTCAAKNIPFRFTGLSTLKIKETDRIEAMKKEMRKLGFVLHDVDGCELYWDGERCEPDFSQGIDTYEDHRMALAFAPYACKQENLVINNPQVVTKSYPRFWDNLQQAGFEIETRDVE